MAKSSYSVSPGNIFGRIGSGIGQGLAEQVPKEIERSRLSSGLQQFEKDAPNLSPMQQIARLSAIPGITPQMIQSFGELGKQQGLRSTLRQGIDPQSKGQPAQDPRIDTALQKINTSSQAKSSKIEAPKQRQMENVLPEQSGQGGILDERNPTRPEVKTFIPPNPKEFESQLSKEWDRNPYLTFEQAYQKTNDYFDRLAKMPDAERAEDARLQKVQNDLQGKFEKSLEKKLQKSGTDLFKDISGEMQNNLVRGMERDIILNPNSNEDDIINTWTNKALSMAKDKDELNTLANRNAFKAFFDQNDTVTRLKNAQKTYAEAENLEEFYNWLRASSTEPTVNNKGEIVELGRTGMGMSALAAAQIAYPKSKGVKQILSSFKPTGKPEDEKRLAMLIEPQITRNDSFLSIAKEIRDAFPEFQISTFLRQLSDDRTKYNWGDRLNRELTTDSHDFLPNWADTWFLPSHRGLNR